MKNSTIKTVIFDIDDTLYNFKECDKKSQTVIINYFKEHFNWTEEKTMTLYKKKMQEQIDKLGFHNASIHNRMIRFQWMLESEGLPVYPHIMNIYNQSWNVILDAIVPETGVIDAFKCLKAHGIQIGLGTDMTTYIQFRKMEQLGILDYVDFILTSEEANCEKPHAHFFELLIEKAQCAPEECVMVGDNWNKDIVGAIGAGMNYLWYHPAKLTNEESEREEYTVRNYKELLEKIIQ